MIGKKVQTEVKAGIFVFSGLMLVLASILLLGGGDAILYSHYDLKAKFEDVSGLTKGSYVKSGGIQIGRVTGIDYSSDYEEVEVTMQVQETFHKRIKSDSKVQMLTQGVLGDKYIEILNGTEAAGPAKEGTYLEVAQAKGFDQIIDDGADAVQMLEESLKNLRQITASFAEDGRSETFFKNLTEVSRNLNSVSNSLNRGKGAEELSATLKNLRILTERVNRGEGTVGALLNDTTLYEDLKLLVGGAARNKVLQFFVRQAVKTSDEEAKEEIEKKEDSAVETTAAKENPEPK